MGRIVIIGGMGPQASIELHRRIIVAASETGAHDNEDYPDILHLSIPVPDFISSGDSASGLRRIAKSLRGIAFRKTDRIVIACNTAHILLPEIEKITGTHIISMIDAVASAVEDKGYKRVALLSTPTTIKSGLYQERFSSAGIGCLVPSAVNQKLLEKAIRAVIDDAVTPQDIANLRRIAEELVQEGAEVIVLGCTELPLIFPGESVAVPTFDCLNVLVDRVLAD